MASVQWLGSTLRFAAISVDTAHAKGAAAPSYRTTVTVTDLASHATQKLLTDAWKHEPYVTLRACPLGRYLLVIPREGATQVWSVPIGAPAVRVRQLPLQFTALAWVAPPHMVRPPPPPQCLPLTLRVCAYLNFWASAGLWRLRDLLATTRGGGGARAAHRRRAGRRRRAAQPAGLN